MFVFLGGVRGSSLNIFVSSLPIFLYSFLYMVQVIDQCLSNIDNTGISFYAIFIYTYVFVCDLKSRQYMHVNHCIE